MQKLLACYPDKFCQNLCKSCPLKRHDVPMNSIPKLLRPMLPESRYATVIVMPQTQMYESVLHGTFRISWGNVKNFLYHEGIE